jgi:hypothetical protein
LNFEGEDGNLNSPEYVDHTRLVLHQPEKWRLVLNVAIAFSDFVCVLWRLKLLLDSPKLSADNLLKSRIEQTWGYSLDH